MATVNMARTSTSSAHVSSFGPNVRLPYLVEVEVNIVDVIATKGSAVAAADVIDVIKLPAKTIVLGAWLQKTAALTGTTTDLTLDFGVTGGDVDAFVDGWDFDGATVGNHGPVATPTAVNQLYDAATTLSVLVATQTGTWLTGKFRAQVLCLDVSDKLTAGIAQLGS